MICESGHRVLQALPAETWSLGCVVADRPGKAGANMHRVEDSILVAWTWQRPPAVSI